MDIELAGSIVEACIRKGVRATLQEDYSASWMRGRKTAGVLLADGDLAQVVAAVISNPQLFMEGESQKFDIEGSLRVSPFRLGLILY